MTVIYVQVFCKFCAFLRTNQSGKSVPMSKYLLVQLFLYLSFYIFRWRLNCRSSQPDRFRLFDSVFFLRCIIQNGANENRTLLKNRMKNSPDFSYPVNTSLTCEIDFLSLANKLGADECIWELSSLIPEIYICSLIRDLGVYSFIRFDVGFRVIVSNARTTDSLSCRKFSFRFWLSYNAWL